MYVSFMDMHTLYVSGMNDLNAYANASERESSISIYSTKRASRRVVCISIYSMDLHSLYRSAYASERESTCSFM